jgi:hypothetical protein
VPVYGADGFVAPLSAVLGDSDQELTIILMLFLQVLWVQGHLLFGILWVAYFNPICFGLHWQF